MDDLRPDAVAARVAAWHNRHPLARRITAADVQAIGFVALPFVPRSGVALADTLADVPTLPLSDAALGPSPGPGSLRMRAQARAARPATLSPGDDPPFDSVRSAPRPRTAPPRRLGSIAALRVWWARLVGRQRAAVLLRGKARLRARALKRAFSERFLPGVSTREAARWALRHGRLEVGHGAHTALRHVLPDARLLGDSRSTTTLYVATAAIEVGKRRARVLLGDGPAANAIGGRLLSGPRVAATLATLALAASLVIGPPLPQPQDLAHWRDSPLWLAVSSWVLRHSGNDPKFQTAGPRLAPFVEPVAEADSAIEPPAVMAAASSPESVLGANPDVAEIAVPAPPAEPVVRMADAAPTPTPAPQQPAALSPDDPPPDTEPAAAPPDVRRGIPSVRPVLDEATKAEARQRVADLRAARGQPAAVAVKEQEQAQPQPQPKEQAQAMQQAQAAAARVPAGAPSYALSTRLLRTRAESEQVLVAWRALLSADPRNPMNVSVMPAGDDFRVVCWPFASRQEAERARGLLVARGMKAETVDF